MSEERRRSDFQRRSGPREPLQDNHNIRGMIGEIEEKLQDAISPESISGLNSFERKLIHRHFDHNKDFETRTYRNGDQYTLSVYPVGNIERYAREKAEESISTGSTVELPPMGSYERFIIHNCLQDVSGVETTSADEGRDRHVQIVCKRFGRGLKRIARKIRLL